MFIVLDSQLIGLREGPEAAGHLASMLKRPGDSLKLPRNDEAEETDQQTYSNHTGRTLELKY